MKSIALSTTQQVNIDFQLASWVERFIAFVVDTLLFLVIGLVLYWMLNNFQILFYVIGTIYALFFSLSIEIYNNGQTLGKKMVKIKVVSLNAKPLTVSDFLMRWCFKVFDILGTGGLLATFLIGTTRYNQRLGDLLANTCVIKLQAQNPLKLKEVLAIKTLNSYTPVYTSITKLKEQDIVLVKATLDDFKKYNNIAHANCVDLCTEKVMELMNISEHQQTTNIEFLQTCIKDYIVLTR